MINDRKISNNDNCSNDDDDDNDNNRESNHCVYSLNSQRNTNTNNNNNNNNNDIIIINGDSSLRGCREKIPATSLGSYHCQQCDSVFTDPSALHQHYKSFHSSLRSSQHSCPDCRKNFASSSGLKQHQHIHQTVKPFRCDVCLKAYTQFSNLCRHKRMHADCRQQIHCRDCLQAFSTLMSLNKHRRFCDGGGGRAPKAPNSGGPPTSSSSPSSASVGVLPLGFSIPGALAIRPGPVESCWMHLYGSCRGSPSGFPVCTPAGAGYIAACMPPFAAAAAAQSVLSAAAHSSLLGQYMGFLHREEEGKASSSSSSSDNEDKVKVKVKGRSFDRNANNSSAKSPNDDVRGDDDDVTDAVEIKKDPEVVDVKVTSVSDVIGGGGTALKNYDDDDTEGDDMTSSASPRHDAVGVTQSPADQSGLVEGPLDLRVKARREREPASPGFGPDHRASSSSFSESGSFHGSKTFDGGIHFPGLLFSGNDHRTSHHHHPHHHQHHHQHHHLPRKTRHLAPHGTPFPQSSTLHRLRKDLIKSFSGALYHPTTTTENHLENQDRHHLLSTAAAATIRGGLRGGKQPPLVASLVRLPDILSIKSTTAAKPKYRYSCRYCGKVFPRSANLTRHLRTHTGEQPYRCKYCKRCFSISSNLQRHVRNIHNKERPFRCPLCDRCFGQQTNLDRHVKKHDADLDPSDPDPCFPVPEYLVPLRSTREDVDQQQRFDDDVQRYLAKANRPSKRFCQGQCQGQDQGQGQDKEAEEEEDEKEGGSPDRDLCARDLKPDQSAICDSDAKISK